MDETHRLLVGRLRNLINDEHQAAIHALETIENYLIRAEEFRGRDALSVLVPLINRLPSSESFRDKVLGCISAEPKTISEIVAETRLTERQVRGVLYAGDIGSKVERMAGVKPVQFRSMKERSIQAFNKMMQAEKSGSPGATGEPPRKDSSPGLDDARRQIFDKPPI